MQVAMRSIGLSLRTLDVQYTEQLLHTWCALHMSRPLLGLA